MPTTNSVLRIGVASLLLAAGCACGATRVNVLFKPGVSAVEQDRALVSAGGTKVKRLAAFRILTMVVPDAAAQETLGQNPLVAAVGEDVLAVAITPLGGESKGKPGGGSPAPSQKIPTGVDRIEAEPALTTHPGTGVTVAIVDTGIDLTHPDLAGNIQGSFNAITTLKSANDDNGHGSHVAGIVAACNNSVGVVGVAPQARLLAVKALNRNGAGYLSDIAEGITWAADRGARVVNLSLGYAAAPSPDPILAAVAYATGKGAVIICSAGNDGPATNTVNYPAKYSECVAVSAWTDLNGAGGPSSGQVSVYGDKDESVAGFSSRGPEVAITAPGVQIYSTYKNGGYATMSGTSMASPHVAGVVARLIQANPSDPDPCATMCGAAEPVSGTPDQVGCGLVRAAP